MLVSQILLAKADDGVVTVLPSALVSDAARVLAERRIGTVVISDDGQRAQGILSERDIVRIIAQRGAGVLNDPVSDHMTAKLVTCSRSASADQILAIMTERRFRHMPVVESGVLVGLITLGDVVKARLSELAMEKDALEGMIAGY